jgi:hypothetical protein
MGEYGSRQGKPKYPWHVPLCDVKLNLSACIPWKNTGRVDEWLDTFLTSILSEQSASRLGCLVLRTSFHGGWTPQPVWMLLGQRKISCPRQDLNPGSSTL